jgi:ATP-dependent helicase/nuclease subunit B
VSTPGFLQRTGPRWFTIPAHRPFVQDLAHGLFDALAPLGPEALSQTTVLVPTRRGARALADAFVSAAAGRAVLPPQMRPLGDLDEGEPPFEPGDLALDLPAAIDPLTRRFELARLVAAQSHLLGRSLDAAGALELADALGGFFDSAEIEEVALDGRLEALVEADLAEHWEVSRRFLEAAIARWPERLAELGLADVSQRRVALLRRLAERWAEAPPTGVLVAAGSTGTAPAARALLTAVAAAPQGCVVLPGLDQDLDDAAWAAVDEQHPQGALRRLLAEAGVERRRVGLWPAAFDLQDAARSARRRLVNEALRPAERTADWLSVIAAIGRPEIEQGLTGLSLISARTEEEAATAAALLLREALETPDKTAALVSPDQALARRVAAKLARWAVIPDSSAGESLAGCRTGVLAGLIARLAVDPLDPIAMLAVLKHPFARLGQAPERLAWAAAILEREGLRGARPQGWTQLMARLAAKRAPEAVTALAQRLQALAESLAGPAKVDAPAAAAARLAAAMEAVAADASGRTGELWAGHGGEAMARLLAALIADQGLPPVSARGFADLLARLMDGETVRAGGATHPRLRILGAIEARLVRADRLIVAGLEEGVWPRAAALDPFLSRPMRKALGLPSPERRIGLSAHDFAQAACAPEVVLLHTERREGAPSVKSRWLWRLETLARGAGLAIPGRHDALAWARTLDAPGGDYCPAARPAPKPPVEHRPDTLFVTRIETLTRDPYAVWARDILELREMRRPAEQADVRVRGSAIHTAFERFALAFPGELPADAAQRFKAFYLEALAAEGVSDAALAREQVLAGEAAAWVVGVEAERRADGRAIHVEKTGRITFPIDGRDFTLAAKADRIEIAPGGLGHVLDYKTGAAPSPQMVSTGFSPQLTLTAAILAEGGFADIGPAEPGELIYLRVTGRRPPGAVELRAAPGGGEKLADSRRAAEAALEGLARLICDYRDPERGYASRIAPQFVRLYASEYDHLARVFEWSTSGEDDE